MCLAVPGEIIEIWEENGFNQGKVRFGGIVRKICLAYVPEAGIGDYVIAHAGFAISKLDEEEAKESLKLFDEMAEKTS